MDEIVKKLGHGVRLKIGALAERFTKPMQFVDESHPDPLDTIGKEVQAFVLAFDKGVVFTEALKAATDLKDLIRELEG